MNNGCAFVQSLVDQRPVYDGKGRKKPKKGKKKKKGLYD